MERSCAALCAVALLILSVLCGLLPAQSGVEPPPTDERIEEAIARACQTPQQIPQQDGSGGEHGVRGDKAKFWGLGPGCTSLLMGGDRAPPVGPGFPRANRYLQTASPGLKRG